MNRTDKALACFEQYNCCQSVLMAFCEATGLSEEASLRLGAGFGGGMNCGETCGAVTGTFMVLGLASSDPEATAGVKQHVLDFSEQFKREHGSLICKELLGATISTEEGRKLAIENQLFETRCPRFISSAVRILEDQLLEKKKGA